MKRMALAGLVLAMILAGAAPACATGEFTSGRWSGSAFFEKGRFTHCAMIADYVSRWKLLFSVDPVGGVSVGFASEYVEMYPWNKTQIWMQIDNDPVLIRDFKSAQAHLIVTNFGIDSDWIKRLRKARKLKVNVGKRVPNFDLAGIDEAFTALFSCVKQYGRA